MATAARLTDDRHISAVRQGARQEAAARRETRLVIEREQSRPNLEIVPRARRRVRLAGAGFTTLFVVMLGLTVFQTQLARQQLEIDRVEQSVEIARIRMTELQKSNAVLRSPVRIVAEARKIGLAPGNPDDFVRVSPVAVDAVARAAGGRLIDDGASTDADPLAEHKRVKSIVAGANP